jgi:hypothetical protein
MLDLLNIRFDNDGAWRNQRACDFGGRRPNRYAEGQENDDGGTSDYVTPN